MAANVLMNKNAFQYDVYRSLQWPSPGGYLPRGMAE